MFPSEITPFPSGIKSRTLRNIFEMFMLDKKLHKDFFIPEWWLSEIVQLSFAGSTGKHQQS